MDTLSERDQRLVLAAEAKGLGWGGITGVARAMGLSRNTIAKGIQELESPTSLDSLRIRCPGAGRKSLITLDRTLAKDLERLIEPGSRGDPQSPLRWTCKSTRHLSQELARLGHHISHATVAALLREMDYSLQANRKTREGARHPDRNAQFEYISRRVQAHIRRGNPAISVDTKKKELVGDFKNGGREWRPKGRPQTVRVHDFLDKRLGKAIPYGVYDLARNVGWVSVGIDHDTAQFAVATIRRWWNRVGCRSYRQARLLLITADAGGSNGRRVRLWKWELQKLANETGMTLSVCHFPPGTSKWNKIEHRLFSFISQNWRGQPLLTHATIINLIAGTRTSTGLKVHAYLDKNRYPKKLHVSDDQMARINLRPHLFHGDWNYTIHPNTTRR